MKNLLSVLAKSMKKIFLLFIISWFLWEIMWTNYEILEVLTATSSAKGFDKFFNIKFNFKEFKQWVKLPKIYMYWLVYNKEFLNILSCKGL